MRYIDDYGNSNRPFTADELSGDKTVYKRVYNVKAYGATGDGATNDLDNINKAASDASADGEGVVYFPAGDYFTNGTIKLYDNVEYIGAGPETRIVQDQGDSIISFQAADVEAGVTKASVRRMAIAGDDTGNSYCKGVDLTNAQYCTVEDVYVSTVEKGVHLLDDGGDCRYNVIRSNKLTDCTFGIHADNGSTKNTLNDNMFVSDDAVVGILFSGTADATYHGNQYNLPSGQPVEGGSWETESPHAQDANFIASVAWDLGGTLADTDTATTTVEMAGAVSLNDFVDAAHNQLGSGRCTIDARVTTAGNPMTGQSKVTSQTGEFETGERLVYSGGGRASASTIGASILLDYDGGIKTINPPLTVRGKTSGTTGSHTDGGGAGATGTLQFTGSLTGAGFTNNEKIVVNHATVNGTIGGSWLLNFDAQSGNFTTGQVVTGGTSGATATIASQQDNGATGILTLSSIVGTFADNEALTDPITGAAVANGTQYKVLNYDAQVINFAVADKIWGRTSGATATVQADTDGGSTGQLSLISITGTFQDDELIDVEYVTANGTNYKTVDYVYGLGGKTGTITGGTSGATGTVQEDVSSPGVVSVWITNLTGDDIEGDENGSLTVKVTPSGY